MPVSCLSLSPPLSSAPALVLFLTDLKLVACACELVASLLCLKTTSAPSHFYLLSMLSLMFSSAYCTPLLCVKSCQHLALYYVHLSRWHLGSYALLCHCVMMFACAVLHVLHYLSALLLVSCTLLACFHAFMLRFWCTVRLPRWHLVVCSCDWHLPQILLQIPSMRHSSNSNPHHYLFIIKT